MAHSDMIEFDDDNFLTSEELTTLEKRLQDWRQQVETEMIESLHTVQKTFPQDADLVDRAENERERQTQLSRMEMNERLLVQIDNALTRIKNGTYGYCEESGDPISFKRLQAWPIAKYALDGRHSKFC
jgi:DnaK suppressor protein